MNLEQLAVYLETRLELPMVYIHEMPDEVDSAVCLSASPKTGSVSQIDAITHRVTVSVRDVSNEAAHKIAVQCFRALSTDEARLETTDTGFIMLPDASFIYVYLRSEPMWDKADQQKRKYFVFEADITTNKI